MAKALIGEIALTVGKHSYTLRPTFSALYDMEQSNQQSIPQLLVALQTTPVSTLLVRSIIERGIQASTPLLKAPPPIRLSPKQWQSLAPTAWRFLLHGLGVISTPQLLHTSSLPPKCTTDQPKEPVHLPDTKPPSTHTHTSSAPLMWDWEKLHTIAIGLLAMDEQSFWQSTMPSFARQYSIYLAKLGLDNLAEGAPATSKDLQWMIEHYPRSHTHSTSLIH